MNPDQITDSHRSRLALVYIRQSSYQQVLDHKMSQLRQRGLVKRALELGWPKERIIEVDEDLGHSASRSSRRLGFEKMVSQTALGKVGIILALEVSRLCRGNRDWYHLLDICSVTRTLIADAEGLYDPRSHNDRLLLGLKGTLSEGELHMMNQRMVEAIREKAKEGKFQFRLAPGLVWDEEGRIQKHPDEQVVNVLELIFQRFEQLGTVNQTQCSLADERIFVPVHAGRKGRLIWKLPSYQRVHRILTNPLYAGAYVFGQIQSHELLDASYRPIKRMRKVPQEDWHSLIKNHHEGFISWEQFEKNLKRIESNRNGDGTIGAAREGDSLLQGLIICGECGRTMAVGYGKGSQPNRYRCAGANKQTGAPVCQSFGSIRLERAVGKLLLQCLEPVGMEAMIQAASDYAEASSREKTHWEQRVERARYEAELARRGYDAVDPTNRLVARELERRYEKALETLATIETEAKAAIQALEKPLNPSEQELLRKYSQDVASLWSALTTRAQSRKDIARCLIQKVVVTIPENGTTFEAKIYWCGGEMSSLELPKGQRGIHRHVSDPELIELISSLAHEFSDTQISRIFHRKRLRTPKGLPFSPNRVACLRNNYGIPPGPKVSRKGEDIHNAVEAAEILGVDRSTVIRWVEVGLLRGAQLTDAAPWRIQVTKEDQQRLTATHVDEEWRPLKAAALALGVSQQAVLQKLNSGKVEGKRVRVGRRSAWRIRLPTTGYDNHPTLFDTDCG